MKGQLYVISAPSGAGKTSLLRTLLKQLDNVMMSVSHTTRPPRVGECDGEHYHFIDKAQFQHSIAENDFLEYATVFDNFYGTSRHAVQTCLESGQDVILEIDWQGAQQICQSMETISIFILPPSYEALEQRLNARQQDSADVIETRLAEARHDMQQCQAADYIVINDHFDLAVQDLLGIFRSQRLRTQQVMKQVLIKDLLGKS